MCFSQRNVQGTQTIVTCKKTIPAHHWLQSSHVANEGQDFDFFVNERNSGALIAGVISTIWFIVLLLEASATKAGLKQ